jgi:transcriptional pleiotropic regulator of transition state genes
MMGIPRRIDQLGRVVVPAEFRKMLGIDSRDELEMCVENDHVALRRVAPACSICASVTRLIRVRERFLCNDCACEVRTKPVCALCQRVDDLREVHGKFLCSSCVSEIVHV